MPEIAAFTADNVRKLTGLSARQIQYWDKTGFFSPTLLDESRRNAYTRVYSFRDVVGLRTISLLRKEYAVPLQELRKVGEWLNARHDEPWSSLTFAVKGRRVVFFDPGSGIPTEPRGAGQKVLAIALKPIAAQMKLASTQLLKRSKDQLGQLVRNRYVVHNAWVVAGTRIPTETIWSYHEAGYSPDQIIGEFPRLTKKDITAAIEFVRGRHRAA